MDYGLSVIEVASSWSLDDFLVLLRRYRQLYSFSYALSQKPFDPRFAERREGVDRWERKRRGPFHQYPYRGGFSMINLFGNIESQVPKPERMRIKRIRISSPGVLELVGNLGPMLGVASAVASVAIDSIRVRRNLRDIRSTLKAMGVQNVDLKNEKELALKKEDVTTIAEASEGIGSTLGLTAKQMENLNARTSDRKITKAKILVGVGKRALDIADMQEVARIKLHRPTKLTVEDVAKMASEIEEDETLRKRLVAMDSERLKAISEEDKAEEEDAEDEDESE